MIYSCGIDIGKSGFIVIHSDGEFNKFPIPLIGKEIDINEFKKILLMHKINHCVIEDLHAIYGSSAGSTFSFGYVCGITEALLTSLNIPFTKVSPKTWQKEMWEGIPIQYKPSTTGKTKVVDTKATSLIAAKRLFPNESFLKTQRSKVPDNNLVDAILLCEYCRRK